MLQVNFGLEMDFFVDIECQCMLVEGLMGLFVIDIDGNIGLWYINGIFGLIVGWDLDLWGKNCVLVKVCIGELKVQVVEQVQICELFFGSVVCLYWQWQMEVVIKVVLQQVKNE